MTKHAGTLRQLILIPCFYIPRPFHRPVFDLLQYAKMMPVSTYKNKLESFSCSFCPKSWSLNILEAKTYHSQLKTQCKRSKTGWWEGLGTIKASFYTLLSISVNSNINSQNFSTCISTCSNRHQNWGIVACTLPMNSIVPPFKLFIMVTFAAS